MDGRCEICRHWARNEMDTRRGRARKCQAVGNLEYFEPGQIPADGAALDYPVCDLWTGPDFVCASFEVDGELAIDELKRNPNYPPPAL